MSVVRSGATDAKITSAKIRAAHGPLAFVNIASPTYDSQPPFSWTGQTCGMLHYGQPDGPWVFPWFTFGESAARVDGYGGAANAAAAPAPAAPAPSPPPQQRPPMKTDEAVATHSPLLEWQPSPRLNASRAFAFRLCVNRTASWRQFGTATL
eukprot:SAG22_NODE_10344_length_540_cov_0.823129_1_plen_151_part_01